MVNAVATAPDPQPATASQEDTCLYSVQGFEAPLALVTMLENHNIVFTNDTLIQIVSIEAHNPQDVFSGVNSTAANNLAVGNALVVTNVIEDVSQTDVLVSVGENGRIQPFNLASESSNMTRDGSTVNYPYPSWDGRLIIHATAVYNHLPDASSGLGMYYQPIGSYFIYEKNVECDVSYIMTEFRCSGPVRSYPGYEDLIADYTYTIPVSKSDPAENTIYSNTRPYDSDKVIYTGNNPSGLNTHGLEMTFNYTVDEEDHFYTLRF